MPNHDTRYLCNYRLSNWLFHLLFLIVLLYSQGAKADVSGRCLSGFHLATLNGINTLSACVGFAQQKADEKVETRAQYYATYQPEVAPSVYAAPAQLERINNITIDIKVVVFSSLGRESSVYYHFEPDEPLDTSTAFSDSCPSGYIAGDTEESCVEDKAPSCNSNELKQQAALEQYSCQANNPSSDLLTANFSWSCNDTAQGADYEFNCVYDQKSCIIGLTCDTSNDEPICNPATENCSVPEPNISTDTSNEWSGASVNSDTMLCESNPEMCAENEEQEVEADPITTPTIETDYLTNINSNIQNLNKDINSLGKKSNDFAQQQVGLLNNINGNIKNELAETNDYLDKIRCLLDEDCSGTTSETVETKSASVDCELNIFECSGDIIQCAILKQQYESNCVVDDIDALKTSFQNFSNVDSESMLVQSDVLDYSKLDETYLNDGVSFGNATCPSPEHIYQDVGMFGVIDVEVSYEPACQLASMLKPLFLIFGWIGGLLIIGRGQGVI